jgi:hypothetical protein
MKKVPRIVRIRGTRDSIGTQPLVYFRIREEYSRIRQSPGTLQTTTTLRAMKLNRAMIAKLTGMMAKQNGSWRHFSFVEHFFG